MPGKGRPHKTMEEHKRDGTWRADRHGGMGLAAEGSPIKPGWLNNDGERAWGLVIEFLKKKKVVGESDSICIEMFLRYYQEYCKGMRFLSDLEFADDKYRVHLLAVEKIRSGLYQQMSVMALDPASRAKVAPSPETLDKSQGLVRDKPSLKFPGGAG